MTAAEQSPLSVTLPEPNEHADLGGVEPGETAAVWHLNGSVTALDDGDATWVRAATASAPMEIAGHDVPDRDLDALERDLLALLAAVRASRAAAAVAADDRAHAAVMATYSDADAPHWSDHDGEPPEPDWMGA